MGTIHLAGITVVPHESIRCSKPYESLWITNNLGAYLISRKSVSICQLVEMEDGKEVVFSLGEGEWAQQIHQEENKASASVASSSGILTST